jgi:hypothetical protein
MKIIHHEGHEGPRRNSKIFASWTFLPFVISGVADAD